MKLGIDHLVLRWVVSTHLFLLLLSPYSGLASGWGEVANNQEDSAHWIVSQSILAHGGSFDFASLSFDFRNKQYVGVFKGGLYEMSRTFKKGSSFYYDKFDNNSFQRSVDKVALDLPKKQQNAYTNSINSVFYFALLPFKLADEAVILEYLEKQTIDNKSYYLVAVSFQQEGGGTDFEDQFRYWFNAETLTLDYLAYSYHTGNGGVRFRSVEKRHPAIAGYQFQDYINYKVDINADLNQLLYKHQKGELQELSRIRLENIKVAPLKRK